MRKHHLAFALVVTAFPAAAAITDPCGTNTAEFYQNSGGCTSGLFSFKNFEWNTAQGGNYVSVPASAVNVTPGATGQDVSVVFLSNQFVATGNQQIFARFDYTIDPPPPILDDFTLSLDASSPVFPGLARITAFICIGDYFSQGCATGSTSLLQVTHNGIVAPPPNTIMFDVPVSIIDVQLTIELFANGASSQINGGGTTAVLMPEPSAALLAAGGLAGLLAYRRWRSKRPALPLS